MPYATPAILMNYKKPFLYFRGTCTTEKRIWFCQICKDKIWYSFDKERLFCMACHISCDPAKAYFRCESHDNFKFVKFDPDKLNESMIQLEPIKTINILMLGETGVGKSTWINGIANFLAYEKMENAIEGGLKIVVPSSFTTIDNEGQMYEIIVEPPENNEFESVEYHNEEGESVTQMPRTYQFSFENTVINMIDTPGMGDTRGEAKDKENFDNILGHLMDYPQIHAICILLKPNNARLT